MSHQLLSTALEIERPARVERVYVTHLVVCATYAALVLLMWAPYTLFSGFSYETQFALSSESRPWYAGFVYEHDPMRIHTSTFYHLSYLLGEVTRVGGSWVPYQIVYATLWWLRGLLVYLLVRRLVPGGTAIAYVTGALVLVHSADSALQTAAQMNQFGFIAWMLLASYAASRAFDAARQPTAALLAIAAAALVHMSLWSYESQLPLLALIPLLLVVAQKPSRGRVLMVIGPWYGLLIVYVALTAYRYQSGDAGGYQQSVMRQSWAPTALLSDWWYNITFSVSVRTWLREAVTNADLGYAAAAVLAFLAGGALVWRHGRSMHAAGSPSLPRLRPLLVMAAVGGLLLAASFPVYLLLDSVRSLWRTQLLSGIGAAACLTAIIALAASVMPRPVRMPVLLLVAAVVVGTGSAAALQLGRHHRLGWEGHRALVREILVAAPSVQSGTYIVLLDVPRATDPFGDAFWLDVAVRLVYPGRRVSAGYFLDDGTPAPGQHMTLALGKWIWDTNGVLPDVGEVGLDRTVILTRQPDGRVVVADRVPDGLCLSGCSQGAYRPHERINGTISDRAVRRYRLTGAASQDQGS